MGQRSTICQRELPPRLPMTPTDPRQDVPASRHTPEAARPAPQGWCHVAHSQEQRSSFQPACGVVDKVFKGQEGGASGCEHRTACPVALPNRLHLCQHAPLGVQTQADQGLPRILGRLDCGQQGRGAGLCYQKHFWEGGAAPAAHAPQYNPACLLTAQHVVRMPSGEQRGDLQRGSPAARLEGELQPAVVLLVVAAAAAGLQALDAPSRHACLHRGC